VDRILVLLSNFYFIQVLLFIGGKDRTLEYTNHEAYLNIKFQLTTIACTYYLYINVYFSLFSTIVFAYGRLRVVTFCQFFDFM